MTDKLVSIRMPRPLVEELRRLVHENHYLDLSEELRSIIRRGAVRYLNPYASDVNELRKSLEHDLKTRNEQLRKEELIRELKNLLEVDK